MRVWALRVRQSGVYVWCMPGTGDMLGAVRVRTGEYRSPVVVSGADRWEMYHYIKRYSRLVMWIVLECVPLQFLTLPPFKNSAFLQFLIFFFFLSHVSDSL